MNNLEKDLLQNAGKTLLQEPVILEVDIHPRHRLHGWMQDYGFLPSKRRLTIRPITLGNLVRISRLLLEMDTRAIDMGNILEANYRLIADHGMQMARIIALAVHNQRTEPPDSLVHFIRDHFTARELAHAAGIVLKQMDLQSFMTTIISVKKMTVMSPKEQRRSIASGEQWAE